MSLKLVKSSELKKYGKIVTDVNRIKTLYLQEGIHTTTKTIIENKLSLIIEN